MDKIYILSTSNAWNGDHELIALCTSMKKAIRLANEHSKYKLNSDDVRSLEEIRQTQGRETNYEISIQQTNTLFD